MPPPATTAVFRLAEMDCPSEGKLVDAALTGAAPVADWLTDYLQRTVTVHLAPGADAADVAALLATTGMSVSRVTPDGPGPEHEPPEDRRLAILMTAAAGLTLCGSVAGPLGAPALAVPLYVAAVVAGGVPTARKAWRAGLRRIIDMNVLMSIAVLGAMAIGEWLEAAVVVVLFALANTLESMSLERARGAIAGLLDLTPPRATVRRDGADAVVPVEEVQVGDRVIVKPGERLPVDGVVVAGRSAVDQSPVTGESRLVPKTVDDTVFAGTLNADGVLELRVTHASRDSTPAKIRRLVEEARAAKAPVQRFVDRLAARYTPAVIGVAVLVALIPPLVFGAPWHAWVYQALVLLVIACPCALVISTPVTLVSHLSAAARRGILIKGGAHLEALAGVCSMVFDKTGTLTEGRPHVAHIQPYAGLTERDVLRYAAALEARASHPLAPVICEAACAAGVDIPDAVDPHTHAGQGVHATVDGRALWVGTLAMATGEGSIPAHVATDVREHEAQGETVVVLGEGVAPLGIVTFADTVRAEARGVIRELRAAGLHHMHMLTGDNATVAESLRAELSLDDAYASLMPEDKVAVVHRLLQAEHRVAMVGDGINDAPALAAATVGIAMGAGGSDVALETAHVALVGDDLRALPKAVAIARSAMRIVRQNVALALGLKGVVFVLALAGMASLWLAIVADMGASLLVIANALRPLAGRSD